MAYHVNERPACGVEGAGAADSAGGIPEAAAGGAVRPAADWSPAAAAAVRLRYHQSMPGYRRTPLISLPDVAARLGVARLLLKDESSRMDLPGESGAAGVAGLLALLGEPGLTDVRARSAVGAGSHVLAFSTEGVTDPRACAELRRDAPGAE